MLALDDPQRRILDAAGQIFAEKGFDGATVREICKGAGVNIAAVNYYYRDKERLYVEAVKHAACGSLEEPKLPPWGPDTPQATRLRDFIAMFVDRILNSVRPPWHIQLIMRELALPTAACAEWVQEYVRPIWTVLQGILADVLPDEPEWRRFMVGASVVGQVLHYVQNRPVVALLAGADAARFGPAAVAEHVTAFTLAALGQAPPLGTSAAARKGEPCSGSP